MAFSWIIVLLAAMVHTIKKEQEDSPQERITTDGVESSDYDEEEWEQFFKEVQQKIDEENREFMEKQKLKKSASTTRQYTRRRNIREQGTSLNVPLTRARSLSGTLQTESPWFTGQDAPSTSTQHRSRSRRGTSNEVELASIRQEQQRLTAEQDRLSRELQHVSSENKKIKKKYSNLSKMLKGILNALSCTSSDTSD